MTGVVAVNGVDLAYDRRGEGEPFVLVHGWTGSGRGWNGVVDHLAKSNSVVTYDQRGHGRSTNTGDLKTYTFDQLVDDFVDLVDGIDLDPFHLLGHSMGGIVAMRYALEHQAQIRSLVLMDTGAGAAPGAADVMQPLIDIVRVGGTSAYYEAARDYVAGSSANGERALADFKTDIAAVDPAAFIAFAEQLSTFESVLDQLSRLSLPTTVIVGENDVNLLPAADDLVSTIPGSVLDVIPDAAHLPHLENREGWLAAVDRHLARVAT